MKTKLLLLSSIATLNSFAQAPDYLWAKSTAGSSFEDARSVTTDASGNVLVAGFFNSATVTFGSSTLTNAGTGNYDMFLVKYDANGNVLWAKNAGGSNIESANSVTADASGNIYVAGQFQSATITFGSTTLTNAGLTDGFLVKYDGAGNVLWAKKAGGSSYDYAFSVTADASGNVIVVGEFQSATITFGSTTLTTAGLTDMFLVKYDANGNVLWAKGAGGSNYDVPFSVNADALGNVLVTGDFKSATITFGSVTLNNAGNYDIFLAKYDANGNLFWAKSAGGNLDDYAQSIAVDASGNVFAAGDFKSSTIAFGSSTLTNIDNTASTTDIFLAKYDSNGNVLWAKNPGGNSSDNALSVAADGSGNIIVAGDFQSPSLVFGSVTVPNSDNLGNTVDMFVAKYNANGNALWAKSTGGSDYDYAEAVAIDVSGNVLVAGQFGSVSLDFGSTTLANTDNTSATNDMFVAKIATVAGIEGPLQADKNRISIYPNPFNSYATIQLNTEINNSYLTIYNIFGQAIKNTNVTGGKIKIDRDNLLSGIYYIHLTKDNKTIATEKLIITD